MKKFLIGLAVGMLLLTGCGPSPTKLGDKSLRQVAKNITYIKDQRTGLCFAILGSQADGGTMIVPQQSITITCVPCAQVKDLIVNVDK